MDVKVVDQTPQLAVAMQRKAATMDNLQTYIEEMAGKVMAYLAEVGVEMVGAPYLKYTMQGSDLSQFDIEWGMPVAKPVPASGELYMTQTYAGKAIVALHQGPYSTLETAYSAIMAYEKEHSLENMGIFYDIYLNDPSQTPESQLLTQVVCPIR